MKYSRREVYSREHKMPESKFEDQRLTSYSGLIIFQPLFRNLQIKEAFRRCFTHLRISEIFGHHIIMMLLVIHLILGYRKLRDVEYYKDDPLVKRLLGLKRMPDVSTVSRALRSADARSIENLRGFCRSRVIQWLKNIYVFRLTLDFDGSVLSTNGRNVEGTAVGFNKKRKGRGVIIRCFVR